MCDQSFAAGRPGTPSPIYVVGQDREGHWLAVEQHGLGGGYFVSKAAALNYVRLETCGMSECCRLVSQPVDLCFDAMSPAEPLLMKAA